MELILLQRVESLGKMGEVVNVKRGYGVNYLLPQKKALRATKANIELFEAQKKSLLELDIKHKDEAQVLADRVADTEPSNRNCIDVKNCQRNKSTSKEDSYI